MPAACRVCGQSEDLAEPFIDGACGDCLRKASGVESSKKKKAPPPRTPALTKGDPLSDSVMEALGIDDVPRQTFAEPTPARLAIAPFRPRDYPALRTIGRVYRVLAVLIGVGFCIIELAAILALVTALSNNADVATLLPPFLVAQFTMVAACVSGILTCVAIAEAIRLGMDIQNNTHAAAHFSEQTAQLTRAG